MLSFRNSKNQYEFEHLGYTTIKILDAKEVEQLKQLFTQVYPNISDKGMILGGLEDDIDLKQSISKQILEIIKTKIEQILENYEIQSSSFLYKAIDKKNEFLPHQDWTMVDEEKFVSVNCWIPLIDINKNNGALCVLPGSHYKNLKIHRSHSFGYFFDEHREILYKYLVPIHVKAGEAIILNHSLIHYSLPNFSKAIRPVCITAIKSKGAPNIMYFKKDENSIDVYEMPDDIKYRYSEYSKDKNLIPHGKKINNIPFSLPQYSSSEVNKIFKNLLLKSSAFQTELDIKKLVFKNKLRLLSNYFK